MGKRVGIKSGAFTLLHAGHIRCFEQCKKQVDYLIVLTNSDKYIKEKKGNVPIPLMDRLYILENISFIDEVDWFSEYTEDEWIKRFYNSDLHFRFGQNAELIIFHSDEIKNQEIVPGKQYADKIIFIPKANKPESVSQIYKEIQNAR